MYSYSGNWVDATDGAWKERWLLTVVDIWKFELSLLLESDIARLWDSNIIHLHTV